MNSFDEFVIELKELTSEANLLQIENTDLKSHLTAALSTIELMKKSKEKDQQLIENLKDELLANKQENNWLEGLIFFVFAIAVILTAFMLYSA